MLTMGMACHRRSFNQTLSRFLYRKQHVGSSIKKKSVPVDRVAQAAGSHSTTALWNVYAKKSLIFAIEGFHFLLPYCIRGAHIGGAFVAECEDLVDVSGQRATLGVPYRGSYR